MSWPSTWITARSRDASSCFTTSRTVPGDGIAAGTRLADLPRPAPRRRAGPCPRRALALALLRGLHAPPERVRQVDHLGFLGRRRLHHLAAFQLGLDQLIQRLAVVILVLLGIERLAQDVDQGEGHLQLPIADLHLVEA